MPLAHRMPFTRTATRMTGCGLPRLQLASPATEVLGEVRHPNPHFQYAGMQLNIHEVENWVINGAAC